MNSKMTVARSPVRSKFCGWSIETIRTVCRTAYVDASAAGADTEGTKNGLRSAAWPDNWVAWSCCGTGSEPVLRTFSQLKPQILKSHPHDRGAAYLAVDAPSDARSPCLYAPPREVHASMRERPSDQPPQSQHLRAC